MIPVRRQGLRHICRAVLALSVAAITAAPQGASACGASPWQMLHGNSMVRLVGSDAPDAGGRYVLGLEFALAGGWHTYWRNPGDSGVATRLEIAASDNLAAGRLHYPAPELLSERIGTSIGISYVYFSDPLFPVTLVAADPARAVRASLDAHFGLCAAICIPQTARFDVVLEPFVSCRDRSAGTRIGEVMAALPALQESRAPRADGPARIEVGADGVHRLSIDVTLSHEDSAVELYAFGPPDIWFPAPQLAGRQGRQARFVAQLTGPARDLAASQFHFLLRENNQIVATDSVAAQGVDLTPLAAQNL